MTDHPHTLARRTWLGGAASAGVAVAAVALLPAAPEPATKVSATGADAPEAATGYQLTEHVKRYYATARV